MSALFLPYLIECCFCCPLSYGSVLVFLIDLVRATYLTFVYHHPICYNIPTAAGLGMYAYFMSFYNMVTALLCPLFALMILLTRLYIGMIRPGSSCSEYFTNGNLYVAFTFTNVLTNILYHVMHYFLVSKADKVCMTGYKLQGKKFVQLNQMKGMSVPTTLLVVFIVDSVIRVFNAAAINALEEDVNVILDQPSA